MGEGLDRGGEDHVRGCHRLGDRPRWFGAVGGTLGDHRQNGFGSRIRRLLAEALADALGRLIADDQDLLGGLHAKAILDNCSHCAVQIAH
jgi:hypothetical protein